MPLVFVWLCLVEILDKLDKFAKCFSSAGILEKLNCEQ